MRVRRRRFANVVATQLEVFLDDHADLLRKTDERLAAYNRGARDDAEELYGDYADELDAAAELLTEMRDRYAQTVDDPDAYVQTFNRAAARRLPALAAELEGP